MRVLKYIFTPHSPQGEVERAIRVGASLAWQFEQKGPRSRRAVNRAMFACMLFLLAPRSDHTSNASQPAHINRPPIGVIAPSLRASNSTNAYNEPLNNNTPPVNSLHANGLC